MRVVVVGNGMAGARVASELHQRRSAPEAPAGIGELEIVVLGAEEHRAYNRILLSSIVAGKAVESDVALVEPAGRGVDVRLGVCVTAIDRASRTVSTSDGGVLGYDRLVLATGARAQLPEIKGLVRDDGTMPDRVAVFRTLDDCRRILALARAAVGPESSGRAVVLGGGLLGLEAARGLAARGLDVTVVHGNPHLMDRQLDQGAGAILTRTLAALGVHSRLDATTVQVREQPDEVRLVFADGESLDADLLVVSCGVRPETALAEAAGLRVERGIVVNDRMATSDPLIFAIGDCAQHDGVTGGLVAPAWAQAQVAADVISGVRPLARYRPAPVVTRLKAAGIDLAAMGESTEPGPDDDEVVFTDPRRGTYAKLVLRGDRLAGAILLGDNPAVGTVIQLFDRGTRVPPDPRGLLLGRALGGPVTPDTEASPALMPDATVVCRCNTVSKGAIVAGFRGGDRDTAQVAARTRATTGCGSCATTVTGILQWLSRTEESPSEEVCA